MGIWYENWRNWGKTVWQIENELKQKASKKEKKNLQALYESSETLLKEMLTKIGKTNELAFRYANSTETNHLNIVYMNLIKAQKIDKNLENLYWSEADLKELAAIIDRLENETLNNLIYEWGWSLVRDMVRRAGIGGYDYSDDGGVIIKEWKKGWWIAHLSDLAPFANRSVHEWYVYEWTNIPTGLTSERSVIWEKNEFILDYSECSEENRSAALVAFSNQLDEVTVSAHSKQGEHTGEIEKDDPSNYSNHKIIVRIEKMRTWYRFLYKNFGEDGWNVWKTQQDLPLFPGLKIYEKSAYEAGFSVRSARTQDELRQKTLNFIDKWTWEYSPEETELQKYTRFFPVASKLQQLLERNLIDGIIEGHSEEYYYYNRFIVATENAVRNAVRHISNKNGVIRLPNPVDENGEVHYTIDNFKTLVKMKFWPHKGNCGDGSFDETLCLWDKLYDIIFNDEVYKKEYIEYLNNSIKSKYEETEDLRQDDYEYHGKLGEKLPEQKLEIITSGLNILSGFFEDLIYSKDWNKNYERCYHSIKQVINMINRKNNNWESVYYGAIKDLITKVADIISNDINFKLENDWIFDGGKSLIYWIIWGARNPQEDYKNNNLSCIPSNYDLNYVESCYRKLSEYYDYVGNERQAMRLINQKDANWEHTLKFGLTEDDQKWKYKEYNDCINNLYKFKLNDNDFYYDAEGKLRITNKLLVNFAKPGIYNNGEFENMLSDEGILPKYYTKILWADGCILLNNINEPEKSYVLKIQGCINEIKYSLESRLKYFGNLQFPSERKIYQRRENRIDELKKLEEKRELSGEESLEYENLRKYKAHPEIGIEIEKIAFENMKTMMFYTGIDDLLFSWFASWYSEITKNTNSELLNDIKWYKGGGFSDKTIQTIQAVITIIAEEALTWAVTAWASGIFSTLKLSVRLMSLAKRIWNYWIKATKFLERMDPRWVNFRNEFISLSNSRTASLRLAKVTKTVDNTLGEFVSLEAWKIFQSRMHWDNPIDTIFNTNYAEDFKNTIKRKVCNLAVDRVYQVASKSWKFDIKNAWDILWANGGHAVTGEITFNCVFSAEKIDRAYILWAFCWQLLKNKIGANQRTVKNIIGRIWNLVFFKDNWKYYCKEKNSTDEKIALDSDKFWHLLTKVDNA